MKSSTRPASASYRRPRLGPGPERSGNPDPAYAHSTFWYVPSRAAVIVVLANDARVEPRDLAELAMRRLPRRGA